LSSRRCSDRTVDGAILRASNEGPRCGRRNIVLQTLERRALLLGLDQPTQSRVDVYQVEAAQKPSQHDLIHAAIMRVVQQQPPAQRALRERLEQLDPETALALLNADNGQARDFGHTTGMELLDRSK